jgi:DNA-binding Xre family transcriptional regulator
MKAVSHRTSPLFETLIPAISEFWNWGFISRNYNLIVIKLGQLNLLRTRALQTLVLRTLVKLNGSQSRWGDMSLNLREQISIYCATIESFGYVLDSICKKRGMTQLELSHKIVRSPAAVSRMMNNELPKYFTFWDVDKIGSLLDCAHEEIAELVAAFICHKLYEFGIIDLDGD